jgi:hypothetical protein
MHIDTESFGTLGQIAAISSNSSQVAVSESCGATYIPSSMACNDGVLDV